MFGVRTGNAIITTYLAALLVLKIGCNHGGSQTSMLLENRRGDGMTTRLPGFPMSRMIGQPRRSERSAALRRPMIGSTVTLMHQRDREQDEASHREPGWCGAILAGGGSSRMGVPKQDLPLPDGRRMIEHVHDAIAAVCPRVVILGDSTALEGLPRLGDRRAGCGPLGGIETLLTTVDATDFLVVPCDLPGLTPHTLARLMKPTDRPAVVFADHPLPARLTPQARPTVTRLLDAGVRAVHRLMAELDAEQISIPKAASNRCTADPSPGEVERDSLRDAGDVRAELANINTPTELARFAARSKQNAPHRP